MRRLFEERECPRVLEELATKNSESGRIFTDLSWSRGDAKRLFRELAERRVQPGLLQVKAGQVLGATRFKQLTGLEPVLCPLCEEEVDSWEHMLSCYQLGDFGLWTCGGMADMVECLHDVCAENCGYPC